jgi:hypothetical protein
MNHVEAKSCDEVIRDIWQQLKQISHEDKTVVISTLQQLHQTSTGTGGIDEIQIEDDLLIQANAHLQEDAELVVIGIPEISIPPPPPSSSKVLLTAWIMLFLP